MTDYEPFLVDEYKQPVVWVDRYNRFWRYDDYDRWVECDDMGRPLDAGRPPVGREPAYGGRDRGYGRDPYYDDVPPRMPSRAGASYEEPRRSSRGGQRYGGSSSASIGIGGSRSSRESSREYRSSARDYKPRSRERVPEPEIIEPVKETISDKLISLYDAGYKPQHGSELLPFMSDDETLKIIIDNDGKTFKFIVESK